MTLTAQSHQQDRARLLRPGQKEHAPEGKRKGRIGQTVNIGHVSVRQEKLGLGQGVPEKAKSARPNSEIAEDGPQLSLLMVKIMLGV